MSRNFQQSGLNTCDRRKEGYDKGSLRFTIADKEYHINNPVSKSLLLRRSIKPFNSENENAPFETCTAILNGI